MIVYILATCVPGNEKESISKLKALPEVLEVNGVMGKYDIFIKVAADDALKVDSAIAKVRSVPHITSTFTMAAIYGQGGTIDDEK
ncbi:MAG TPA: Lrp/AsnC ligand binding domain-containing protein [Nitrosopumilaceae archaeon]|nr:Lrp/AsnC ligand binding domain-containing protein [Nitrosopumilaceae archaeon]